MAISRSESPPFLHDIETARGTAERWFETAPINGYTLETIGAPLVVPDGPRGLLDMRLIVGGLSLNEVEGVQTIVEGDDLISLARAKGHPRSGLGRAIKNVGVGCATKCRRAPAHLARKPYVNQEKCDDCGACVSFQQRRIIHLRV